MSDELNNRKIDQRAVSDELNNLARQLGEENTDYGYGTETVERLPDDEIRLTFYRDEDGAKVFAYSFTDLRDARLFATRILIAAFDE